MVTIEGVFMGANVKTTNFEGNSKTSLYVDVYQPDSQQNEKMIQLKSDDVALINTLNSDYAMGSVMKISASVNAYKNKAYFKLLEII